MNNRSMRVRWTVTTGLMVTACLMLGGCSRAIVVDNLRVNAADFLIGVFAESVQSTVGLR